MSGDEREQPSEGPSPGSSPGQRQRQRQRKSPGPSSPTLPATPTPTATPPDLDARWPSLADHAATVADAPRETIVPPSTDHAIDIAVTTAGKRTLGLLREIDAAPAKRLEVSDQKLGRGGMSDVWLGEQTALGRPVAVKTVREDLGSAGGQTTAARELLREAVLTGRLEHPNVLPVHDLTLAEDGAPLIVLKRVEGESWTELLEAPARLRARFGVEDPLRWHLQTFMQVCSAAHAAHARGVVHRDIKPDNVMIGPYGEVYLMDWGIAVAVPPAEGERSAGADLGAYDPSVLAGTPVYLAPEMVLGEPVTPRTDVYLLGATLFELLSGDPPHVAGSLRAIAQKALRREPPPLPERVAPDLAALCRRCLRFDPAERFESAEQLRRAVQRYLEQRESRLLAENARDDLVALETAVEEAVARPEEKASHVFDLYGACRFGFQAALRAWPENAEAREGLTRAVEAMIRLEIARQNARGAEALLAELEAPPAALRQQVQEALAEREAARAEVAALAAFRQELDPRVGRRGRFLAAAVLSVVWVSSPLVQHFTTGPRAETHTKGLITPLVYMGLVAALVWWRRREVLASRYNRRLVFTALFHFVAELTLSVGQWQAGMDPTAAHVQDFGLRAATLGYAAIFIDVRMLLTSVAAFGAYFLAATHPELRYLATAGSDAILGATLLWMWRPRERRAARVG